MMHDQPVILLEGLYSRQQLDELRAAYPIGVTKDIYELQLKEFFDITHPTLCNTKEGAAHYDEFLAERQAHGKELCGSWVYYPWSGCLIHMIGPEEFRQLRCNRNRDLITVSEQQQLLKKKVGVVGLSIGNSVARVLALSGIAGRLQLIEYDILENTNMNRLFARVDEIGTPKLTILTRQLYEYDPYLDLAAVPDGLNIQTLELLHGPEAAHIYVDAVDDFAMKVALRRHARAARIPVVMATSVGDSVLIDIERFDTEPDRPMFHGVLEDVISEIEAGDLSEEKKHECAVRIVGSEVVSQRAADSIRKIGSELVGRPQLMSTVSVAAGFCAYVIRDILLDRPVKSGRIHIPFADIFSRQQT